jgi:hypothetical protein
MLINLLAQNEKAPRREAAGLAKRNVLAVSFMLLNNAC